MHKTTNHDLFVMVKSIDALASLQVNANSAKALAEKHNIVAYCLLTPETFSDKNHIHMRYYAPAVGIDEDPFTGYVLV